MGSVLDRLKAAGKEITDRIEILSEEETNYRMDICKKCENYNVNPTTGTGRCEVCGCFMVIKTKFAQLACPIAKWGKKEDTHNKDLWDKASKSNE
jgi:hypothetical protein